MLHANMNGQYKYKVSLKNYNQLLRILQNMSGDYFFLRTLYIQVGHFFWLFRTSTLIRTSQNAASFEQGESFQTPIYFIGNSVLFISKLHNVIRVIINNNGYRLVSLVSLWNIII